MIFHTVTVIIGKESDGGNGGFPLDYSQAHVYHWLKNELGDGLVSSVLQSEKAPLENRIWYSYPGQDVNGDILTGSSSTPSVIARVYPTGIRR